MTQQFDEAFILDGQQTTTSSRPLSQYFEKNPRPSPPPVGAQPFDPSMSSALRRGYKGTWTLRDEKLVDVNYPDRSATTILAGGSGG
jgi:hypothetical protein